MVAALFAHTNQQARAHDVSAFLAQNPMQKQQKLIMQLLLHAVLDSQHAVLQPIPCRASRGPDTKSAAFKADQDGLGASALWLKVSATISPYSTHTAQAAKNALKTSEGVSSLRGGKLSVNSIGQCERHL